MKSAKQKETTEPTKHLIYAITSPGPNFHVASMHCELTEEEFMRYNVWTATHSTGFCGQTILVLDSLDEQYRHDALVAMQGLHECVINYVKATPDIVEFDDLVEILDKIAPGYAKFQKKRTQAKKETIDKIKNAIREYKNSVGD